MFTDYDVDHLFGFLVTCNSAKQTLMEPLSTSVFSPSEVFTISVQMRIPHHINVHLYRTHVKKKEVKMKMKN